MKKGDNVICIDNGKIKNLKLNKTYTIRYVDVLTVSLQEIKNSHYKFDRFILLSENRKNKLNKLNESNL